MGWGEQPQPLIGSRPWAFVPVGLCTAAFCAATVVLAARRSLGASTLPDRSTAAPHTAPLGRPASLAVRLTRPMLISWLAAIGTSRAILGTVAKTGGTALSGSALSRDIARLGAVATNGGQGLPRDLLHHRGKR